MYIFKLLTHCLNSLSEVKESMKGFAAALKVNFNMRKEASSSPFMRQGASLLLLWFDYIGIAD